MDKEPILVQDLIVEIRGQKVILDSALARLYKVETRTLKQAVRRNIDRFPEDFMFELSIEESNTLFSRSHFVTLNDGRGSNTKYKPYVFTEQGVAMLSSVLRSDTAIKVNIAIMRAFVKIRQYVMSTAAITSELKELRAKVDLLAMQQEENLGAINDLSEDVRRDIGNLYLAIGELSSRIEEKKQEPRRKIGFQQNIDD